jgi:HD-GYP domain-containing protein (c-di-GMP phosphodiesterase class II)
MGSCSLGSSSQSISRAQRNRARSRVTSAALTSSPPKTSFSAPTFAHFTVRLADKDEYTERHTRRVAMLAVRVGEQLGLSASRLRTLAIGGLVHDIGKLSVPDAILKKPGALNDDEYGVVQCHPE